MLLFTCPVVSMFLFSMLVSSEDHQTILTFLFVDLFLCKITTVSFRGLLATDY